ncbi:MAG: nucleoside-diphosphate sugar epimerase [Solibacillus sp.]
MNLQQLQQDVKKQLTQNGWVVRDELLYSLPVHTVEVSYYPVQRTVMDILMKMMLISYERAALKDPELLADILLVEPLFIHDLTNKMMQLGMLKKSEGGLIELTTKGRLQKEQGVFEEQLPMQTEQLYYSPTHAAFFGGDIDEFAELADIPALSPYACEALGDIDPQPLISYLTELQPLPLEDEPQTFVTEIEQLTPIQVNDIPLLQFICYEEKSDKLFVKVWNSLTNEWDAVMEELITTNERAKWLSLYEKL